MTRPLGRHGQPVRIRGRAAGRVEHTGRRPTSSSAPGKTPRHTLPARASAMASRRDRFYGSQRGSLRPKRGLQTRWRAHQASHRIAGSEQLRHKSPADIAGSARYGNALQFRVSPGLWALLQSIRKATRNPTHPLQLGQQHRRCPGQPRIFPAWPLIIRGPPSQRHLCAYPQKYPPTQENRRIVHNNAQSCPTRSPRRAPPKPQNLIIPKPLLAVGFVRSILRLSANWARSPGLAR